MASWFYLYILCMYRRLKEGSDCIMTSSRSETTMGYNGMYDDCRSYLLLATNRHENGTTDCDTAVETIYSVGVNSITSLDPSSPPSPLTQPLFAPQ